VWFNPNDCYVKDNKDKCRFIVKGNGVGRMFRLDVNMPEMNAAMFAHCARVVANINICHKIIGHVNVQRMRSMQTIEIVIGMLKFKANGMQKVCEACQFGK